MPVDLETAAATSFPTATGPSAAIFDVPGIKFNPASRSREVAETIVAQVPLLLAGSVLALGAFSAGSAGA